MYGLSCFGAHLEVARGALAQHAGRERPERLAELDLEVHHALHLRVRGSPRMLRAPSARGPNSIRPWNQPTTLSAPSAPRRGRASAASSVEAVVDGALRSSRYALTRRRRNFGPSSEPCWVSVPLLCAACRAAVPGEQRRAERAAGIARRRLDPDPLERPFAQEPPLATQLSATPPARHRFFSRSPSRGRAAPIFSITSSVTFWIDAARSISRCVSSASACAAGRRTARRTSRSSCVRPSGS
jgi:hypothetical protein